MVQQSTAAAERGRFRPIILDTIVNQDIRGRSGNVVLLHDRYFLDLRPLGTGTDFPALVLSTVGKSHSIGHNPTTWKAH
jgi:hypothetical protein